MKEHEHHEHPRGGDDESPPLEKLMERGVFSGAELSATIEKVESATPALGAAVVAAAWSDAGFASELARPGAATNAINRRLGIDAGYPMHVVVNQPGLHNLITCTLCSCYPRGLLGAPPSWYKSLEYRSRAITEPRAVLREFGVHLPSTTRISVHDSTADLRYLVLPLRPSGTDNWSEPELSNLVTRDSMIGTGLPLDPGSAHPINRR
jgi:nitrile hydratase